MILEEVMSQPQVQKLLRDRMHRILLHDSLLASLLRPHLDAIESNEHNIAFP